jgi:hypothetical protein
MEGREEHRVEIVHCPHYSVLDDCLEIVARCHDLALALKLMECLKHDG